MRYRISVCLFLLFSLIWAATPAMALVKPVLTVTAVSDSVLRLNWTDGDNETGYRIRVSDTGAAGTFSTLAEVGANVLTFDHTGLAPNTTKFYRVVAFNAGGQTPPSDIVSGTTLSPPPPPPPQCEGVNVVAPASIQAAINANPTGTTFCLSGTFTVQAPIHPKDGQSFIGPAVLQAAPNVHSGFELKGVESGANVNAENVTIRDLEISGFTLRAIECWTGSVIDDNYLHHNLRNGVGCGMANSGLVTITNNEIAFNGSEAELGRGGGGMKIANTGPDGTAVGTGSIVRGNYSHHNIGIGLWCDVDCSGDLFEDNIAEFNTEDGIQYEISHGPVTIRNNIVRNNNTSLRGAHGGILLNSSCPAGDPGSCLVTGNTLANNGLTGIRIRDDGRPYGVPFEIAVTNNTLNGNGTVGCELAGVTCTGNS